MLDTFEIFTTSGIVLWSRTYVPINPVVINSLITNVFIEERQGAKFSGDISAADNPLYQHDKHTIKWTTVKELGLIFVAVYRSLLHLSWVDKLVDNIKAIFVNLYGDQLRKPHTTIVLCKFDDYFDQQIREIDKSITFSASQPLTSSIESQITIAPESHEFFEKPSKSSGSIREENISENSRENGLDENSTSTSPEAFRISSTVNHLLTEKPGLGAKISRRARKAAKNPPAYARDEPKSKISRAVAKKGRKWDDNGLDEDSSEKVLDYSALLDEITLQRDHLGERPGAMEKIENSSWGSKDSSGKFVLKDLDDQVTAILASQSAQKKDEKRPNGVIETGLSTLTALFKNVVGGKILTSEDLEKSMKGMEDHLLKKNVAREAAVRLCNGVEAELIGTKTGSFESVQSSIQKAMESSLRKILTPTSSMDLLREIEAITSPSNFPSQMRRPYVISIVGVNGVGKSTSLSKICYFLLQNKLKVLVVACDTFRSGAVEQLAVHVRNLQELTDREGGVVQLYQKGYGKDAANVARDAVVYATQESFDVVLIDTAGRRHNDQRLMSSLEKFAKFSNPDKIFMVGEALVGTDSVAQARNFNAAFGTGRTLDGFIISKCDTVGDMVGTLVSMVHATNVPVLFIGIGQHYSDLRCLSVKWAVERLLSSA
ncbi:Signal recognition particle receptor subunit alpha-like protein [Golovinomyces cichoracearum]|uniref:Signal recognition particle receptor subunit alpha homolog n=1 Tax=Golovinomyces cichoracearum TaxID=62708 RepID=A0A420IAX3_9PEZI|nr:Signal recognition particle receptor subunit alpha-like protein [Golovinomyces cichoracearum]